MTVPRQLLVDRTAVGLYHCISSCVRRAFLCGDGFEHRKDWIRDRLQHLAGSFAIDVAAYAVMSNHLHVVVRTDPDRAAEWSAIEVVTRWSRLFPASVLSWAANAPGQPGPSRDGRSQAEPSPTGPGEPSPETAIDRAVRIVGADVDRVALLRDRLSSLSWFMRCTKEPIARRANREDGCTGCFWDGRFRSPRLLDDAAVLTGMVYVDLNPVRAGLATTPERSEHTSVQDRIRARQLFEKSRIRRRSAPKRARRLMLGSVTLRSPEDGTWLAPIEQRPGDDRPRPGVLPLTLDEYLTVVDTTGRMVREGKRGCIPPGLAPILERLKVESAAWVAACSRLGRVFGTAMGSAEARAAEAARREVKRVVGSMGQPVPDS